MPKEFILFFVLAVAALIALAFIWAGADLYFNTSDSASFWKVAGLNIIVALVGGAMMIGLFYLLEHIQVGWTGPGHLIEYRPNDTFVTILNVLISMLGMFILKKSLIAKFGIVFPYPATTILIELLAVMVIPAMAYFFLQEFGKAFQH